MINNKIFLILFSLLLISPLILATVGYSETDYGVHFESPKAPTNYSSVNVNNSATSDYATNAGQLETRDTATLYTYFKGLYDLIYCKLTGCTMAGDIDMGENDLDNVGDIEGGGTGSWFNESLLISGDSPISKDSNANLWIRAEVNYDACINLSEGSVLGTSICYLGSGGGGETVISDMQTGTKFMTIDRDSGNISFLNDTTFTNIDVHNITSVLVTASAIRGTFGIGAIDLRGDPWYFSGADFQIVENLIVDKNVTADTYFGDGLGTLINRFKTLFVETINFNTTANDVYWNTSLVDDVATINWYVGGADGTESAAVIYDLTEFNQLNGTGVQATFQNLTVIDNNLCNATACFTLQDLNASSGGAAGIWTNVSGVATYPGSVNITGNMTFTSTENVSNIIWNNGTADILMVSFAD